MAAQNRTLHMNTFSQDKDVNSDLIYSNASK